MSSDSRASGLGGRFWRLLAGSSLSNVTDGMRRIAFPWLAATLTDNPLIVAAVAAAAGSAWLLFTLPGGVMADRLDRRRVVVSSNLVRASVLGLIGALLLVDMAPVEILIPLALLIGWCEVMGDTSTQTMVPLLIDPEQRTRASGLVLATQGVLSGLIGGPCAGLLCAVSIPAAFFAMAGTSLAAAGIVLTLRGEFRVTGPAERSGMLADFKDGVRWVWRQPLLRDVGLALGASNIFFAAAMAAFVLYAREVLGLSASGYGLLVSALAIGSIGGSLAAEHIARRLGEERTFTLTFAGSTASFAIVGFTSSTIGAAIGLVLIGALFAAFDAVWTSLRWRIVPEELMGRVTGVLRFVEQAPGPVGALLAGPIILFGAFVSDRLFGLHLPYMTCTIVFAILGLIVRLRTRASLVAEQS